MILIKFIIMGSLVLICIKLGIIKSQIFENRVYELNNIKSALVFFRSKLEFTYEPINEIFNEISKSIYFEKENIFKNCILNLQDSDIQTAWNNAVERENEIFEEDKNILYGFGKLLGKTDLNGQISEVELSLEFLEKQIEKAEILKNKNCKLYKSLGTFAGIGLVIILI